MAARKQTKRRIAASTRLFELALTIRLQEDAYECVAWDDDVARRIKERLQTADAATVIGDDWGLPAELLEVRVDANRALRVAELESAIWRILEELRNAWPLTHAKHQEPDISASVRSWTREQLPDYPRGGGASGRKGAVPETNATESGGRGRDPAARITVTAALRRLRAAAVAGELKPEHQEALGQLLKEAQTVAAREEAARPGAEEVVQSRELAQAEGEPLQEELVLRLASLPDLRETLLREHEQSQIDALGLGKSAITELVERAEHAELCRRFAAAREQLGLHALQLPFDSYQSALAPLGSWSGPTKKIKRALVSDLNAAADALCAMFEVGSQRGRLDVTGAEPGTFQLRAELRSSGKPLGLGQTVPSLRLRARRGKRDEGS